MPENDPDAHDTSLARVLHARSAATVEVLQASLAEARRRRALGGSSEDASLAAVISERSLVAAPVLAEARRSLSGEDARVMTGGLSSSEALRPRDNFALPPQLGPFRLRRELARGGMGAVWEVEHIESGGLYALKTILAAGRLEGPGGEAMARFRREVELGARLDHPNVVRVHSADVEGDPPWLVQTYLPGGSLDERLKRQGALPVEEAAAITAKVARGLAHAHARGVLHRDLKPPNVLFDAEGQPRIVDFGVARSLREGTMRLTATGEVLGSPAYMAPEQALGEKAIDARADVHALGALLYALLTGGPPFKGKTSLEVIEQVISKPAPPPSASRAGVPPAVDAVALRCLEKDPAARFQTADEVAAALEAWLAPVEAPARRSRALVALAVAALVAVASGGAAVALGRRPTVQVGGPAPVTTRPIERLPERLPRDWSATLAATSSFGLAWRDFVGAEKGGLSLSFERLGPIDEEGDELRLRLRVVRLAYTVEAPGGGAGLDELGILEFDSGLEADRERLSGASRDRLGPIAAAMAHVLACSTATLELRLDRRTGAVRRLTGFGAPDLTDASHQPMLAELCSLLTSHLSDEAVSGHLENVLHVLPPGEADASWTVERTLRPYPESQVVANLLTRSGPPGLFELSVASDARAKPRWETWVTPSTRGHDKTKDKASTTITGRVRLEAGLIVESVLDIGVHSRELDLTGEPRWCARGWTITWNPGEAQPPPPRRKKK